MESRYLRGGHGEAGRRERALEALPNAGHTPGYTRIKTTAQDVDTHSKRVLLQEEFEALLDAPASTPPEDAPWSERRTAREDGAGRYGSRPTAFGAEMVMPLGARERREALTPELGSYDYILLNESAGKDSQAMMDLVVELAEAAGARDRIVAGHKGVGGGARQALRAAYRVSEARAGRSARADRAAREVSRQAEQVLY